MNIFNNYMNLITCDSALLLKWCLPHWSTVTPAVDVCIFQRARLWFYILADVRRYM